MQTISVNLKERSYKILVGCNILSAAPRFMSALKLGEDAYVITNASIKNKYGKLLTRALKNKYPGLRFKLVPDTEKSKSLKYVYSIIEDIAGFDRKRRIFIIAFGGGVVGDLAAFVASIYKRGIPCIQVPTTLLAQVDSGIGGKTAVDLPEAKNLVGTFYQPRMVLSDVCLLKTLAARQMRAGLAEVIKYGLIKDPQLFAYLEKKWNKALAGDPQALEFIVARCSRIKAHIVQQDEKETKRIRTILNFGHTLGHAIEAASGYKGYNHGEAVALGMLLAADLSHRMGLIGCGLCERIEALVKNVGLPSRLPRRYLNGVIKAHYRDKKFIGSRNRFVLLQGIGKAKITENVPLKLIREVLEARS